MKLQTSLRVKLLGLVWGGLLLCSPLYSQEALEGLAAKDERTEVTWSSFREKVRNVVPDFSLEEIKERSSEIQQKAVLNNGDINFGLDSSIALSQDVPQANPLLGTSDRSSLSIKPSISKTILPSGTTLSAGLDYSWNRIDASMLNTQSIGPRFSVTQSLLNNFLGSLNRLNISNAERDVAIAKSQRELAERSLQKAYDKSYLTWILLWRQNDLLRDQIVKSRASYQNAQRQRRTGYIDNGTLNQIYNNYLQYQQSMLNNQRDLLIMDTQLQDILGGKLYRPDLNELEDLLKAALDGFEPVNYEDSWLWDISRQNLDKLKITYKIQKENALPSLNLTASLGLSTSASYLDDATPEFSDLSPTYSVGISLKWPVLMRAARNGILTYENQIKQLETTMDKQSREFAMSIQKQQLSHQASVARYELLKESLDTQRQIYATTRTKYTQARASIRDLLSSEIQLLGQELSILATENELVNQLLDYLYETRDRDILALQNGGR